MYEGGVYEGGVVGFSGYVELGDDGQWVGKGEGGVKEEVRDGRGGEGERGRGGEGEGIRFGAQWTPAGTPAGVHQLGRSRHPLPCGSGLHGRVVPKFSSPKIGDSR